MNIKESCTPTLEKPKISICTRSSETDSVSQEDKLQLSKTQFCIWYFFPNTGPVVFPPNKGFWP